MKLLIFFLFSILVVDSLFCDAKPKNKPTTTTTITTTTTSSPPRGCVYMYKRESASYSAIHLDKPKPLETTSKISKKEGHEVTDFARHHVISWSTISSFFNLVLRDPLIKIETCRGMFHVMNKLMSENVLEDMKQPTAIDNFIVSLIQSKNLRGYNSMMKNSQNPQMLTKRIHEFFTWLPGNIFIGPAPDIRGDDPEEEFEELARYIIGEAHHNLLKETNIQMVKYINAFSLLSQDDGYAIVNKVLELFNKISLYPVTPYNSQNWRFDKITKKWLIKKEFLKLDPINKPVPGASKTPRSVLGRTRRQLKTNSGCTYDEMYNSILSEVRKNCISKDASCGCQLSKT
eukprot:XP_003248017.1 PREDICTED: uncharacterized protein LOC100569341 [Acyrthosiphon pisum]